VTFPESDLARLAQLEEIEVETRSTDGVVHRTIVWPVVRDATVYLRSVRGPTARWYREALADPSVALHVDGHRLPARALPARDQSSVEACSAALRDKYPRSSSLNAMLVDDVLPTTLKLVPA
jgi:Uncharacterized protein conserved in bacteria (DUF2255).